MRTRTSAVSYSGQTWIFISGRVTPGFTDSYPSGAGRTREAVELSPAVEEVVSSAQAGSAAVTRRTNIAKIITESFAGRPLKIRANDITRRLAPLERPRICIINHPPLAITTPPCPGPDPGAHSYHWGDHQPRAPTTTPHLHQPEQESHLSVAVASSPGRPASWYGRIPQGISPLPPVPGTTRKDCRPPTIWEQEQAACCPIWPVNPNSRRSGWGAQELQSAEILWERTWPKEGSNLLRSRHHSESTPSCPPHTPEQEPVPPHRPLVQSGRKRSEPPPKLP